MNDFQYALSADTTELVRLCICRNMPEMYASSKTQVIDSLVNKDRFLLDEYGVLSVSSTYIHDDPIVVFF